MTEKNYACSCIFVINRQVVCERTNAAMAFHTHTAIWFNQGH